MHRGLVGRVIYKKDIKWKPTLRRPAAIEQKASIRAVVDSRGVILRMNSALSLDTNVSKQPLADGTYSDVKGISPPLSVRPLATRVLLSSPM